MLPEQQNAVFELDLSQATPAPGGGAGADFTAWPEFHNGVAAGEIMGLHLKTKSVLHVHSISNVSQNNEKIRSSWRKYARAAWVWVKLTFIQLAEWHLTRIVFLLWLISIWHCRAATCTWKYSNDSHVDCVQQAKGAFLYTCRDADGSWTYRQALWPWIKNFCLDRWCSKCAQQIEPEHDWPPICLCERVGHCSLDLDF